MDRGEVIKALECCTDHDHRADCYGCYQEGPGFGIVCRENLMRDALELLKDQEDLTEAFNEAVQRCREYMEKCGAIPTSNKKRIFFADSKGNITPLPEIVRCKDCKWWTITSPTFPIKGFCGCYHGEHDGDWFCADGVVKDNCSEIPNN